MGRFELTVRRYTSIDEVDPGTWNAIVGGGDVINTHAHLRAVEHAKLQGLEHRYLELYRGQRLVAHASVSLFTFSLDVMADRFWKLVLGVFGPLARRVLSATVVECGHPTALGSSIVVLEGEDRREILLAIDQELVRLAAENGTSLIDLRDVYVSQKRQFDVLLRRGYRAFPNMANTFLRVYQRSFDEYLSDLVSKRRYEILRRRRLFFRQGGSLEKVVDFAGIAVELEALWNNTYRHASEYRREVLNAEYFRRISKELGEKSFVLLCRKGDRLIGFSMLLDSGDTLVSTYCGLDYSLNRSMYTYFVLFYRSIEEAIDLGKKWLELGVTNYSPKMEVGAIPKPMYIYAKSTRPLLNSVLTPLLRLMSAPREFDQRRIFNSRFYERHRIQGEMIALVERRAYRVRDVSAEGIGIEGEQRPGNRRAVIDVHDQDGVFVRLYGRLRNMERGGNGTWRIGFRVRTVSPDFLPLWHNLVQRRAGRIGERDE